MLTPVRLALGKFGRLVALSVVAAFGLMQAAPVLAQTSVSTSLVTFAMPIPVGTTAAAQQVTSTNNQATALTISGISVSGHFSLSGSTCPISPSTLAAGRSCIASVTFTPTQTGLAQGQLTFTDNAANSPTKVTLFGAGTTGGATSLNNAALAFGNVALGQTSASQFFTLTNNTASSITVTNVTVPAHYAVNSNACATLTAGALCNIGITFTPAALGGTNGAVAITDSADPTPVGAYVYGTGVIPVTISPNPLAFGNVPVGIQTVQNVTVTNNQSTPVTHGVSTLIGAGYHVVTGSTTCPFPPASLAAGTSCVIAIGITPAATGSLPGTLTFVSNAPNSPQVLAITATGVPATFLTPCSVSFGNVAINTTSVVKTVTLKNVLSTALTVNSIAVTSSSPFAIDPTSTCNGVTSLAGGASCTINLTASPTTLAASTGTLTVSDSAPGSPHTVALSVTGVPAV